MTQGFKATLFAGIMTFGVLAPAYAEAPVITNIPDVTIGDVDAPSANLFEYDAPFSLNDHVTFDGDKSTLAWSFGESDSDGLATQQYTINGVKSAVFGDTALAEEAENGYPNTKSPASAIDGDSATTTFRDIILSPEGSSGPFADPSTSEAAKAADGKLITYFVSDGANVASKTGIVRSVDNGSSTLTSPSSWSEEVVDSDFSSWVESGVESTGVSIARGTGELAISLTETAGVGRVYGWKKNDMMEYNDVGADKIVRGKFYISTSNAITAATNTVPGFRLRVTNEGAVDQAAHFEYAVTALASPAHEPRYALGEDANAETQAGKYLRPSNSVTQPSLYRLDFDPTDVPAAAGSNIGALIESYTYSDKANGTLKLHEVVLGTYDVPQDADGTLIFEFDRNKGLNAGVGGLKKMEGGAFNVEANFEAGRRQRLFIPGDGPPFDGEAGGPYGVNMYGPDYGLNAGLIGSTRGTDLTRFAMDLLDVQTVENAERVRISPNKLYRAKFYALAILPAHSENPNEIVQGNMRFRFQTAANTVSYLYELSSRAVSQGPETDAISVQALPSNQAENPATEEQYEVDPVLGARGGWYNITVASPLDDDGIRKNEGNDFGTLGAAPGPGSDAASIRDVKLGVDLIQAPTQLVIAPGEAPIPFAQPNHTEVGIQAVKVYEFDAIDDGGYDFTPEPL